jgi:gluconolactonase
MKDQAPPRIEVLHSEMAEVVASDARFEAIATGLRFTEGPVWLPRREILVFSDIPANRLYRWTSAEGLAVFREPSQNANGNTLDLEGRLVTCEHGSRLVTRGEPDGRVTILAGRHQGGRLNSPNDIVFKRDGTAWFTDPPYGLGDRAKEQPGNYVFRLDPGAVEPVPVVTDFLMPNGLCFSPDERLLYIADSSHERHHVRRFRVKAGNQLEDDGVFATIVPHVPDGMRVDAQGRLFCTAGDGVQVFRPDGTLVGKFLTPQTAANCCFGEREGRTLFITATSSVWRVELKRGT